MTTEVRVLDAEDKLIAAADLFRPAMVGFPPLPSLQPGQILKLLEPGRTVGAFVDRLLVGTADAVRLIDAAQAWDIPPRIYAENRSSRPGTIDCPQVWW